MNIKYYFGGICMKKLVSILIIAVLLISALTVTAAAAITESGTTGDCTWTLDNDGTLTISGNGATGDYNWNDNAPWYDMEVKKIVIENGVTKIGSHAFYYCVNAKAITISAGQRYFNRQQGV